MNSRNTKSGLALALVLLLLLIGGVLAVARPDSTIGRTTATAYFAESTGLYSGDDVVILGVRVGKIEKIEPEPTRVKITFWYRNKYKVPADTKAVILSPSLVTPRSIQLTPAYTGGAVLAAGAVIPQERTAVPVEYDDLRQQLERLTQTLQPTEPGGTSTLGAFINTAADNLRGQGLTSATPSSSCHRPYPRSATTATTCSAPSRTCRPWSRRCVAAVICCSS